MHKLLAVSTIMAAAALIIALAQAAEPETVMDHRGAMKDHGGHCGMPTGEGVINTLDVKKSKADITHEPIESIGWPEMKMDFPVLKPVDLAAFAAGERVHFMLKAKKDKSYSIAMMCSLDADQGMHEACMAKMHDVAMTTAAGAACAMDGMGDTKKVDHDGMDMSGETSKADHKSHH